MCAGGCTCGKGENSVANQGNILSRYEAGNDITMAQYRNINIENLRVDTEIIEVRFKNKRKEFYKNSRMLDLKKDVRVVVAAAGGHDIGTVTLSGEQANKLYKLKRPGTTKSSLDEVQRLANEMDLNTWLDSRKQDRNFLLIARQLVESLKLDLQIIDIEVRGDGKKAGIFYTSASGQDLKEFQNLCIASFKMKTELHDSFDMRTAGREKEDAPCC